MIRARKTLAVGVVALGSLAFAGTALASATREVYVGNSGNSTVSYFPTPADTPINSISSVSNASHVVFTPDGSHAYVIQAGIGGGNKVNYIRTSDNTSLGTISVGSSPESIAITPDGSKVYVGNGNPYLGASNLDYGISVIHTSDNSVTNIDMGDATLPNATAPDNVAVTPDGSQLWVATRFPNKVTVFNTATDTLATLSGGSNPFSYTGGGGFASAIAFTPNGSTAYVAEQVGQEVTPIDVATQTHGTAISTSGQLANDVAISPDGTVGYVTLANATVLVFNTSDNSVRTGTGYPIAVGLSPNGLAFTPNGDTVYVANTNGPNTVTPINTTTSPPTPGTALTVGTNPQAVAVQPDQGPTADFTDTPATAGTPTGFDGSASADNDGGSVAKYHWDFGDGHSADTATATTTHTYAAGGNYNVTLTVTDDEGCSDSTVYNGHENYCTPHNGSKTSQVTIAGAPGGGGGGTTTTPSTTTPTTPTPPPAKKCKKSKKHHASAAKKKKCKK